MSVQAEFEFTVRKYDPDKRYDVLQVVKDFLKSQELSADMMADVEGSGDDEQVVAYTPAAVVINGIGRWEEEVTSAFNNWVSQHYAGTCVCDFRMLKME